MSSAVRIVAAPQGIHVARLDHANLAVPTHETIRFLSSAMPALASAPKQTFHGGRCSRRTDEFYLALRRDRRSAHRGSVFGNHGTNHLGFESTTSTPGGALRALASTRLDVPTPTLTEACVLYDRAGNDGNCAVASDDLPSERLRAADQAHLDTSRSPPVADAGAVPRRIARFQSDVPIATVPNRVRHKSCSHASR